MFGKRKKATKMEFFPAPNIDEKVQKIVTLLEMDHIIPEQVHAFRSTGSQARARARIYAMPRIWQMALGHGAHYCIEFLSEHFDHLHNDDQLRVIIHELMHIPKSFSGALVPHRGSGHRHQVTTRSVEVLFRKFKELI